MSLLYRKYGIISALLSYILLVALCACSIIPQTGQKLNGQPDPGITPIASPYQKLRIVDACINTPPISSYFRLAAAVIADRVDSYITVNEGGLLVYVSYISSHSFGDEAWHVAVPAIPADEGQPTLSPTPNPASFTNPYDHANAVATVTRANTQITTSWQAQLKSNHEKLAAIRAEVKKATDTLRAITPPFDPVANDYLGCLADASQHLANTNVNAEKYLIIVDPHENNTLVNASSSINLSGVSVREIFRSCAVASVCQATDHADEQLLRSYGARDVQIFDVAQSEALHITF